MIALCVFCCEVGHAQQLTRAALQHVMAMLGMEKKVGELWKICEVVGCKKCVAMLGEVQGEGGGGAVGWGYVPIK